MKQFIYHLRVGLTGDQVNLFFKFQRDHGNLKVGDFIIDLGNNANTFIIFNDDQTKIVNFSNVSYVEIDSIKEIDVPGPEVEQVVKVEELQELMEEKPIKKKKSKKKEE